MLFFVNKPEEKMLDRIARIGGDEAKALLLAGDAVCFGAAFWQERLQALDVDAVYVAGDALAARNITLSDDCEVVGYDEIVDLLLSGDEKVVSL
jgi:sulfur relay protein TusB/DsrH